jgi:phospholipid/cholesterol/gamma-HCH transport system substrate-binding protein
VITTNGNQGARGMSNRLETIIGLIVLMIAVAFFVFTYSTTNIKKLDKSYPLKARFTQVEGIVVGSDVMMSGIKVGSVTSLKIDKDTYYAVMGFSVDKSLKLPVDSSLKIATSGLLGGKYVAITAGSSEEMLEPNAEIKYTQASLNLEGLLSKLLFSISSDKKESK